MMSQIVQHATQKIIDLLPENEQYYRLDELRSWGVPVFMVQRIKVELERNMAESMILPKTDWANVESEAVQQAWQQFVQAIRAEARLPASYARAVIETAIVDVLDMLVEPRKNIPDVIFGGDEELDFTELSQRVEAVVVYPHFAALLPRYMQKKNLETLSREQCVKVIAQADEKITANYSPLNWAQTLDPLFKLLDDDIDPSLLRLFFEDKERARIAEAFGRKDQELSRAEFIETLTSPSLLDSPAVGNKEDEETESRKGQSEVTADSTEDWQESSKMEEGPESKKDKESVETDASIQSLDKEEKAEQPEAPVAASNDPVKEGSSDEQDSTKSEAGQDFQDETDDQPQENNSAGMGAQAESDDATANGSDSINAAFGSGGEGGFPSYSFADDDEDDTDSEVQPPEPSAQPADADEDRPIWMSFVSEEESEALDSDEGREEEMPPDIEESDTYSTQSSEEEFLETPAADHAPEKLSMSDAEKLKEHLERHEAYYIEDIFGGSKQDYEGAIESVSSCDSWQEASKYIQNDIFERNVVNLYSQTAVDFTDRLQDYFLDKKNNETD